MDIFQTIGARLAEFKGDTFHLHQGKLYENPNPRKDLPAELKFLIEPQTHSIEGGEKLLLSRVAEVFIGSNHFSNQITLTSGGTNALWLAFTSLISRDRPLVHVLSPYWMYLPGVIKASGGEIKETSTLGERDVLNEDEILFKLLSSLTSRSSVIYLANPANPVGNIFSENFIRQLIQICNSHDLHLVIDHAYFGFTRFVMADNELEALPRYYNHQRVVNAFTFSKLFGIAGLRLGFIQSNTLLTTKMTELYRNTNYTLNSYSQSVVYEYLKDFKLIQSRQEKYKENLKIYEDFMVQRGPSPDGGFFSFIRLPVNLTPEDLANHGFGVVEGHYFGHKPAGWARICFTAEPPAKLRNALNSFNKLIGEIL